MSSEQELISGISCSSPMKSALRRDMVEFLKNRMEEKEEYKTDIRCWK